MNGYIEYEGLRIWYRINDLEAYPPKEDSFLLTKHISFSGKKVLDLGCGSGIQGLIAYKNKNSVVFADIDESSVKIAKINFVYNFIKKENPLDILTNLERYIFPNSVKFVQSNLFSNISEKFDVILFNPPYLPPEGYEDEKLKRWVVGGEVGNEIIIEFLKQAKRYLNKNGFILLVYSSLSDPFTIGKTARDLGYNIEIIDKEKFFFEELYLAKLYLIKI